MAAAVVSRRLSAAHRAHVALVVAESLLLAGSAGTVTWAATLARLPPDAGAQALWIAGIVSLLAGATWALERLEDRESLAREIDRRSGLRGAVLTAFQAEATASPSDVARLLGARVAPEVSPIGLLRSALRSSAPLLALPCLSIAILSIAVDAAGGPGRALRQDPAAGSVLASGVAGRADLVRSRAELLAATPDLAPGLEAESRRISADAASLRTRVLGLDPMSAGAEDEIRELERRLDVLRRTISPGVVTGEEARGRMAGPDSGADRSPDGSMRAEVEPPRTLDPAFVGERGEQGERGVLASRWWASRYDGIVDRWIASRRESPAR